MRRLYSMFVQFFVLMKRKAWLGIFFIGFDFWFLCFFPKRNQTPKESWGRCFCFGGFQEEPKPPPPPRPKKFGGSFCFHGLWEDPKSSKETWEASFFFVAFRTNWIPQEIFWRGVLFFQGSVSCCFHFQRAYFTYVVVGCTTSVARAWIWNP